MTQVNTSLALLIAALSAGAQVQGPDGPINAVSEQLQAARRKQQGGEYDAARTILLTALSKAPGSPSLLGGLGSVEQDLGKYVEAERLYLRALSPSARNEGDLERITLLHNLGTLYLDTHQYSRSDRVCEQLERLEPGVFKDHPGMAGLLLNVIASLEHARNRDEEAERYYVRSLTLLKQAHGAASLEAAAVKSNLGFLRLEAGRYESAADLFRQAIDETERVAGRDDPALIRTLVNLARCENMNSDPIQAEPVARRAVELSTKVFGEMHPITATAMLEQAAALRRLRCTRAARDLEKRANACLRDNSKANLSGYTVELRNLAGTTAR